MGYKEKYNLWLNDVYFDEETKQELRTITDEKEIEDRFYTDLKFGTAGLRGKIGAGTNRMNQYTVSLATQGLAQTIVNKGKEAMDRGVAIAYDVRKFSKEFAEITARVLAANGVKAYLFDNLRATPILSYTVRKLKCISGVVVTASHNPKDYNGYKVYWEEGSQILDNIADEVLDEIGKINSFSEVKIMEKESAIKNGLIEIIGKEIDDAYNEELLKMTINDDIDKDIKIVYTPLNGTGNIPVRRILRERGFTNVTVVPEQENPDSNFTTVGYPNPEDVKAFTYAAELGGKIGAELLIATDPDCDRVAIGAMNENGYTYLNGNQTGALIINYILSSRHSKNDLPKNSAIVKSIVTGDLGKVIAEKYGVKTVETLTGFKNICSKANEWEKTKEFEYILGYEESIGYVYGTLVRDKDGVVTSMMIAEMAAYYKKQGKSILEVLDDIYEEYGYYSEKLISIVLEGLEGQQKIKRIMENIRHNPIETIGDIRLEKTIDFLYDKTDVGVSDVLKYYLDDGSWYAIRPSGTEPKIKLYIYSTAKTIDESFTKIDLIEKTVRERMETVE
ncbi:phospho-sugar mutase [Tissierella sp. Yu-01]|uniref:phospho-sugar mutase n=1 Tax=Tissierella sp. Yu-01 TaxID=3035694 RepID=UPI00240E5A2A|nr:phospho-sugar mutase [Tissierella sp. Yu-01]WFA09958.1 phospho-sugar mutase [Tissierella sp. Yu-01]